MKKIFKWISILLLMVLIALVATPYFFRDKIISTIKEEVNKNLNAKVEFGDFDLTLISSFPDFKFSLNNLIIVGIDSFANDTLLKVKQLSLNVNLMSVIKGEKYQISKIALDKANILAKVLKSGKANWDIGKVSEEIEPSKPAESASPFKMSLKKFEIIDANVYYQDEQMNFETSLVNFNHILSGDFTQDNFTINSNTSVDQFTVIYGGVKYLNKVRTKIKADLDADMPNFKFTFKENELQLNELFLGIDGSFAMPKEDMNLDLSLKAKKTEFKNILSLIPTVYSKDFETVKTSGKLALNASIKGIYNDKKIPGFNVELLVENAMFQYPSLPKSVSNINVDVKINNKTGDPDNTIINVNRFHVEMAGNPIEVKMHVSTPVSDANIDGNIKGKLDLTSIKDIIPLEKGDEMKGLVLADVTLKGRMSSIEKEKYDEFNASGKLTLSNMDYKTTDIQYPISIKGMAVNFTPQYVELSDFNSIIGKSDLQANGKIENFLQYVFKDDLIKGRFNISSRLLDLNELMGNESTSATTENVDTSAASIVEIPNNIDFILSSTFKKVLYDNMEMTNMLGELIIKDSKVTMSGLKMSMLEGNLVADGSYSTKNTKTPSMNFDLTITDFDLPKTYKTFSTIEKLAPVAKYCKGKFSTSIKFSSILDNKMEPILTTLSGSGKLKTNNVIISGFEPLNKLSEVSKMNKYKTLAMNNVDILFSFKNGRVDIEPFDVKIENSNINISGSNGFDQTINYKMNIEVPTSELGGAASVVNGMLANVGAGLGEKIKLIALVGGTATKPTVKIDFGGSEGKKASDVLKDKVKDELDRKKKELEEKARLEAENAKKELEAKGKAEAEKLKKEAEAKAKAEADKLKKEAENKLKNQAKDQIKGLLKKPK